MLVANEQLISFVSPETADAVIQYLGELLVANNCMHADGIAALNVNDKELPCLFGTVAVLHLGSADTKYLRNQGGVALAVSRTGIEWRPGKKVTVIFAIALPEVARITAYSQIAALSMDSTRLSAMLEAERASDLLSLVNGALPQMTDFVEPRKKTSPVSNEAVRSSRIIDPNGIHARPAAKLTELAGQFQSKITIEYQGNTASCRSVGGLLGLEISHAAEVVVRAEGPDAETAVEAIAAALAKGLDSRVTEEEHEVHVAGGMPSLPLSTISCRGISASPGIGAAPAVVVTSAKLEISEQAADSAEEHKKLDAALAHGKTQLLDLAQQLRASGNMSGAEIFEAHRALMDDEELIAKTRQWIDSGKTASFAWNTVCGEKAEELSHSDNALLAERAGDYRDVARRILAHLEEKEICCSWPETGEFVVIAEDLTPSQTADLPRDRVAGIATASGGPTAHTAILARSMGIPAVVSVGDPCRQIHNGQMVIVEGTEGFIEVAPEEYRLQEAKKVCQAVDAFRGALQKESSLAALTTDGKRIEVFANIASVEDAAESVKSGAEGVGLLRTELLVQELTAAPDEEFLVEKLCAVAKPFGEHEIIVRTYDIGGDKPVPFLPVEPEKNPFLGIRGLRLCLRHEAVFRTLLRSIVRAAAQDNRKFQIMLPMVSFPSEFEQARKIYDEEVAVSGLPRLPLGMMIEVPAVIWMMEEFAKIADFFSIGSNDLTQYICAMDRQHPLLAGDADALHPAVLRAIAVAVTVAKRYGKKIGVCGNLAGDPVGAQVLAGLGIDELSMASGAIPEIKALLRKANYEDLQKRAAKALLCENGKDVRTLYR